MADKKYTAQITLQDKFTKTMEKAIKTSEQFSKKMDNIDKRMQVLSKPKTITIKAKLDGSVNNAVNTLNRTIPKNMRIKISANQDISRSMDQARRDIFSMTNSVNSAVNGSLSRMANGVRANVSRIRGSMSNIGGSISGTVGNIGGSVGSAISTGITGSLAGSVAGGAIMGGIIARGRNNRSNSSSAPQSTPATADAAGAAQSAAAFGPPATIATRWKNLVAEIKKAWQGLGNGMSSVWNKISQGAGNIANKIKTSLGNALSAIKNNIANRLPESFKAAWNSIVKGAAKAGNGIANGVLKGVSMLPGRVGSMATGVRTQMALLNQNFSQYARGLNIPIKIKDFATAGLQRIKSVLLAIVRTPARITLGLKNLALAGINKVKTLINNLKSKAHNIVVAVKSSAAGRAIGKIYNTLKSITGKAWKVVTTIKDKVSPVVKKVAGALKSVAGKAWNVTLKGVNKIGGMIKSVAGKIASLAKAGGAIAIGGAVMAVKEAGTLESQALAMQHYYERMNKLADGSGKAQTEAYIKNLTDFANSTPFETGDIISAGQRGIQVAGGDTKEAERLVKLSTDMAALNPGKSVGDAMEALADLKMGESARMVEFGMKLSAEDIEGLGGADKAFQKLTSDAGGIGRLYNGGATKFAESFNGLWSTIVGKFKSGLASFGKPIMEALKGPMKTVTGFIDSFSAQAPAIGEKVVSVFKGIGTVVGPIFESIGNVFANVFGKIDIGKYANGMITTFQTIGKAIGDLFNNPAFQEGFANMVNGLINFSAMAQPVIQSVISTLGKIIPPIIDIVSAIMDALGPALGYIGQAFAVAIPLIGQIIQDVTPTIVKLIGGLKPVFAVIGEAVLAIVEAVQYAWPLISDVIKVAGDIISPILSIISTVAGVIVDIFKVLWPPIVGVIEKVWEGIKPVFEFISDALEGISEFISGVVDGFKSMLDWGGKAIDKVSKSKWNPKNWFGDDEDSENAVGLNYVPKDGYIAKLHQGEMVLTTQEANMYRNQHAQSALANRRLSFSGAGSTNNNTSNSINPVINVYGINDPEQLADKIVPVLTRRLNAKSTNALPV